VKINGPLLGREGTSTTMSLVYVSPPRFPLSPLAFSPVLEFNGPTIYELTSRIIERKYRDKTIGLVTSFSSSRARIVN